MTPEFAVISVEHRLIEGYHTFTSGDAGLYVSNKDPKRAFESVAPSLEKLIKFNTGVDCRVEPAVNFSEFVRSAKNSGEGGDFHPSVIAPQLFVMRAIEESPVK